MFKVTIQNQLNNLNDHFLLSCKKLCFEFVCATSTNRPTVNTIGWLICNDDKLMWLYQPQA